MTTIYGSTFGASWAPHGKEPKLEERKPIAKKQSITGKKSTKLTRRQKRILNEVFNPEDAKWGPL
jgi:hypothetical protein